MSDFLNSLFLTKDDKLVTGSDINEISKIVYNTKITSKEVFDLTRFKGLVKEVQMKDLGIHYFLEYKNGELLPDYFKQIYHLTNYRHYSGYYNKIIYTIEYFKTASTIIAYKNLCDDISRDIDIKIKDIESGAKDDTIIPRIIPKSSESQMYLFNGICVNIIKLDEKDKESADTLYSANAINWTDGRIHKGCVIRGELKEILAFIRDLIFYEPKQ